jgi:DNA-binding SARP family transcriptional activator/predicted ATPase
VNRGTAIRLHLLGVPRLTVAGRGVAVSWQRRSLSLLTYLFTARGVAARDAVGSALWPEDDDETARGNLRRNLNLLRAALPPEIGHWIVAEPASLGFDRSVADTDVTAFEAAAADPLRYAEAVALYGGDFAEPLYDAWVLAERERLRARYHAVLGDLIGERFSARRFEEALEFARRILADEPFREDVLRRVMTIRYAMGDRPGALAEFERFRRALAREMNVEPMPETAALRDLALRGEPLPSAPDMLPRTSRSQAAGFVSVLPFGGREAALEAVATAWRASAAGDGIVAFVSGEAGIGKTRLLAEALERVVGSGARILRGTTASPEARPFESVLAAFAQAAPYLGSIEIEPVWRDVLAALIPEFGSPDGTSQRSALPPDRETLRVYEAMTRLLAALARARPVVVILEDLHWAGPATLAALAFIARRLHGRRILMLATVRDGESEPAAALRRELCAAGHARSIALAPLSGDEARTVLARLSDPPGAAAANLLVARSEGNPLFLTELLREYQQDRRVDAGAIDELVRTRLDRAGTDAQTIARAAAICGPTFDLDMLQAILGWSDDALIDGIAELLKRQFVRATATYERGTYAFTHALVREAIVERAPEGERRRVHRIVARALEERASGATYAAETARHWHEAGDTARAAQAYARAAGASLAAHARDEAAALASAGLGLTADPGLRGELLRIRIESSLRRAQTIALRADVAELSALAARRDESAAYEAAQLAFRIEIVCGDRDSKERATAALRAFRIDGAPMRAAEIAEAEAKTAMESGDFGAALAAAERARASYRELGADREELRASLFVAKMLGHRGDRPAADALLATLEERVEAAAEPQLTIDYWVARSNAAHATYDAGAMLHACERIDRAARDIGDRMTEANAAWQASAAHATAGRYTHAFREIARAIEIYASLDAVEPIRSIRNNLASALISAGRTAEATDILRDNLRSARERGVLEGEYFATSNLGVARLHAGDAPEACDLQRSALELARRIGSDAYVALALGDLGAALAAAGNVAEGVARLRESAEMNLALHRLGTRAHDLARAARWDPDPALALSDARTALATADADGERIKNAPEIFWCCALAFDRAGDSAAAAFARRRGRELLLARASAIEDETDRRGFLAISHHAELLACEPPGSGRVKASTKAKASSSSAK